MITKAGARIEVLLNATTRRNEHGEVIGASTIHLGSYHPSVLCSQLLFILDIPGVVGIGQDVRNNADYPLKQHHELIYTAVLCQRLLHA